jgi:hypothetical protein
MWCIIWKRDGSNLYEIFTNLIFESEKKAIEFKDKQKSMRKNMIAELLNIIINILKE